MESEYVTCSTAVQEGVWLKRFITKLGIVACASETITIYCDNIATLAYAKDPKYHGKTKHINIRYHFIRDMVAQEEVVLKHISMSLLVVDPLTKPISREAYVRSLRLHRL